MEHSVSGVIVADNDVIIRGVLRSMLAGVGQDVFVAANGEEALAFASRMRARLVLLDLEMPRINGLVVCRKLRTMPGYENTPIAILTGHDGEEARRAAAQVGATLFIAKPFQTASLLQKLAQHLNIDMGTQEALARAARRAQEIALPDSKRQAVARGNPSFADEALKCMLDRSRDVLDVYRQ